MNPPLPPLAAAILAGCLVLVLPGAALRVWQHRTGDFLEGLADSVGISLSLCALIAMGAFFFHIRLSSTAVAGFYALMGLVFAAGLAARIRSGARLPRLAWLGALAGLGALGALIAWRLAQARGLALPAWVDPVHHVMIVQKIMTLGGLPDTMAPEVPVLFSYHYAFHLAAALFARAAGQDAVQASLVMGQVMNALVSLSIYRLGKAIWQDAWRAGLAALLAGFAFHMPAYYLTWGRDTLLTGLVVLPLAMAAVLDAGRAFSTQPLGSRSVLGMLLPVALLTSGLALSHYTTLWLFGLFLGVWGLVRLFTHLPGERRKLVLLALAVFTGLLLAGPWLIRMLSALQQYVQVDVVAPGEADQSGYLRYLLILIGPRFNLWLMGLSAAALLVNLFQARARWLALWGLLLALLALPWGPRFGPFRPDHYAIVLFLPAALLLADGSARLGAAAGWLAARKSPEEPGNGRPVLARAVPLVVMALVGGGLLVWGARDTRHIINPVTVLATQADVQAIDWVRGHTPPEARFFINTTFWQGTAYRGVDGGYWLPTLTGRQTIQPNAMYGYGEPSYVRRVEDQAKRASEMTTCGDDFWALVDEAGLSYVYVKEGAGSLQPAVLNECNGLQLVYGQNGVFIYQVVR